MRERDKPDATVNQAVMKRLTTTIKRHYLCEIVAGRKKIKYREIKPYWELRLANVSPPFELRLINGMSRNAPQVTVEIRKIVRNTRRGTFDLHISRVIDVKNWNRRREKPSAR